MLSRRVSVSLALALLAACGAAKAPPTAAPSPDAGADASADASAPAERAFAGSAGEATQLINDLIDKKRVELQKCVAAHRARNNTPHAPVSLSVGIDQEGRLIGITLPKGKKDEALTACVSDALRSVAFPRSHSGVITVTRSYEEILQ